jgi:hypothetical protein
MSKPEAHQIRQSKKAEQKMGIFWIASYPKSGNTWVRSFLANVMASQRPVPLNKLGIYCPSEASSVWYKPFGDIETMNAGPTRENMELRQQVQERASMNATPRHILMKTHNQRRRFKGLPLVREDLTVGGIYMVRDPRDVAVSLAEHAGKELDEAVAQLSRSNTLLGPSGEMKGRQMFELIGSWSDHVNSWTEDDDNRVRILRYEDCLADPEATLGSLPPIMGITKDVWRIKAALAASSFDALKAVEAKHGFNEKSEHTESFFARGRAGGWKELLSNAQAKKIERDHKKVMQKFGYL